MFDEISLLMSSCETQTSEIAATYPWFMSCSVSSSHIRTWIALPSRIKWKISSMLWVHLWSVDVPRCQCVSLSLSSHWSRCAAAATISALKLSSDQSAPIFTILTLDWSLKYHCLSIIDDDDNRCTGDTLDQVDDDGDDDDVVCDSNTQTLVTHQTQTDHCSLSTHLSPLYSLQSHLAASGGIKMMISTVYSVCVAVKKQMCCYVWTTGTLANNGALHDAMRSRLPLLRRI